MSGTVANIADHRPSNFDVKTIDGLTGPQITNRAGITYRQLDFWCRAGLVPGFPQIVGSGTPRVFTEEQAEFVEALAILVRAGLPPRLAAEALVDQAIDGDLPTTVELAGGVRVTFTIPARAVTS